MSFKEDLTHYTDGYGLIAPHRISPGTMRSSDNGTMFLGEKHAILSKRGEATSQDIDEWERIISNCMLEPGLSCRVPGVHDQDSPDNMLGILAPAKIYARPKVPLQILSYGFKHWGFFNQEAPGTFRTAQGDRINWDAFLWRQPQLLCAAISAACVKRWYHFPLYFYAALVIFYAAVQNYPTGDADSRRLCWLLIQCVAPDSILCWLASKLWYSKLRKDYPGQGMRGVAAVYYEAGHPFITAWVD